MQELLGPAAVPAGGVRAWLRCSQHDKRRRCGGRRRARPSCETRGLAAVPVGGGGAWRLVTTSPARLEADARPAGPGRASRRRAEPKARSAGGPPPTGTPSSPARRGRPRGGRRSGGATRNTSRKAPHRPPRRVVLISYLVPLFFPSSSTTKGKTRVKGQKELVEG